MTQPHIERMQQEHDELAARVAKLTRFVSLEESTTFAGLHAIDRFLLKAQHSLMLQYLGILTLRLNRGQHE